MQNGLNTYITASAEAIGRGENLVWVPNLPASGGASAGGWSSCIGYEPYFPDWVDAGWAPFSNLPRIDSLHVWQKAPGLHFILFEAGGTLYLLHEWGTGGSPELLALQSGRHIPTLLDPSSTYTALQGGTLLITNGHDAPVLLRPWPLGTPAQAGSAVDQVVRPFGTSHPAPPTPRPVAPIDATTGSRRSTSVPRGGDDVSVWWSSSPALLGYSGLAGIGWASTDTDPLQNQFSYQVSFVMDTGAESPLSPVGILAWESPATQQATRHVPAINIPTGPKGVVARKLFRSRNYAEGTSSEDDDSTYLTLIIPNNIDDFVFDPTLDSALGAAAPRVGTSIPLPATTPRFADVFLSRLVLAGDPAAPHTVFLSNQNNPEQFSEGDAISLPPQGGQVTGLKAHYAMLLVFREKSLDVIGTDLQASVLLAGVECLAPHSAINTPHGIVFAARDGLYLVQGGLQGGAQVAVHKLSEHPTIASVWSRQVASSGPMLVRSCAVWDAGRQEYWLQVPPNGDDRPSLGIVWHPNVPSANGFGCFTLRVGFPVGCFALLPNGEVLFGHYEGNPDQDDSPAGLFVVSARRAMGIVGPVEDAWTAAGPPTSLFRSPWLDFGEPRTLKLITGVSPDMLASGNNQVSLEYASNGVGGFSATDTRLAQPVDMAKLAVWATDNDDVDGETLPFENLLQDEFGAADGLMTSPRLSVGSLRGASFCWQISTTDDFVLRGYTISGTVGQTSRTPGHKE